MEEEKKNTFESGAMKYLDWGAEQPREEIYDTPAHEEEKPITEEPQPEEHVETEEEANERIREEQQKYYQRLQEEQKKAMQKLKESMGKIREDMMKLNGGVPLDVDIDDYVEQMKNIKPEEINTPESDKVFFAWIESKIPGIMAEVQEELIKQKIAEKEKIQQYLKDVGIQMDEELTDSDSNNSDN